uniref:Uncharacterized protein n=1 Tax=Leptobrachium leishanense TaxID=445787 RepID=A0A8C5PV66_9ANUR
MREILSTATPLQLQRNKEPRKDHTVGIFSRSAEEDYSWLQKRLRSDGFRDWVQEVRSCYISSSGYRQFHQDVSQCSFGILYHTKNRGRVNVTDVTDALYNDELRYLSDTLGRENVVVVIDDLDDSGPDMRSRILQNQPSIETLSQDLILFGKEEKIDWDNYLPAIQNPDPKKLQEKYLPEIRSPDPKKLQEKYLPELQSLDQEKLQEKLSVIKGWIKPADERRRPSENQKNTFIEGAKAKYEDAFNCARYNLQKKRFPVSRSWKPDIQFNLGQLRSKTHRVGIFSRSAEVEYSWLQTRLRSYRFSHCVQEVTPCYISSSGYRQFYQDVSQCSFGILYHSKNRGRVNVTDVTDALYNDELRYLSETLGRENVLVVIDDLEDSGPDMRSRILQTQPSIKTLAQDLILFSKEKKNLDENLKVIERLLRAADKAMLHQENKATSASYPNPISSTQHGQEMVKYAAASQSQSAKVNQPVSNTKSEKPETRKETNKQANRHNRSQKKSDTMWEPNDPYKQEAASSTKHSERDFSTRVNSANSIGLSSSKSSSPKLTVGIFSSRKHTVGIFSRSAEEDYSWLQTLLGSDRFRDRVQEVRSCYISSSGYQQFHQDVSQCSFGILYHTKNRGRINVTDVTGALYNDELRYLSDKLGRENVVVVIDDLDDSGPVERSRILQNQLSIGKLAGDLILCDRDKENLKNIKSLIKALNTLNLATKQEVTSSDSYTTQKTSSSSSSQYGADPGGSLTRGSIKSNPERSDRRHGGGDPSDPPNQAPEGSAPLSGNNSQSHPSREDQERSKNSRKSNRSSNRREDKAVVSSGNRGGSWRSFFTSAIQTFTQHAAPICSSTRHTIGIFSRSAEEDYSWLQTLLRSDGFRDRVQEVTPCYISSSGYRQFYQDVSQCSFGILYHTKNRGTINVTDMSGALYDDELRYLSDKLGRENVLVVIDDLDDSGPDMRSRILQTQPSIERLSRDLILFSNEEKSDWEKYLPAKQSPDPRKLQEKYLPAKQSPDPRKLQEKYLPAKQSPDPRKLQEKLNIIKRWIKPPGGMTPALKETAVTSSKTFLPMEWMRAIKAYALHPASEFGVFVPEPVKRYISQEPINKFKDWISSTPHTVGIFSRSAEEDYSWLQTRLRSDAFQNRVQEVRSCYISSSGFRQFHQDVSQCSFGILYHSKNRGRVNVTDVTDALYNDELRYLSDALGRENVAVLIDDLDDSGPNMRSRILQNQPSIERLAGDLILCDRDKSRNLRTLESLIKATSTRNLVNNEPDIEEPRPSPDKNTQSAQRDQDTQSAQRDRDTLSAQRDQDTQSAQPDQDTQSAQLDQDKQATQLDQDTQSAQSDQDTQSAQLDQDTQSAQRDRDTQSAQPDQDTLSAQPDQDTQSAQPDQDTQSAQLDQDKQATQLDQDTQSAQSDQDTQSAQLDQDTQSAQPDQDTQSAQPDQDTQSAQLDQDTLSAESKQEDSVLVLKQINLLDQQNPAGCSAQHIKVINGAQDGAQYLEKQNISLMDELPRMVYRQSTLHTIGIFSRSAEEDYLWLQTLLGSDRFRDRVQEVRSCYISSSGYRQFYQDVSQCSFGILYHTKIRGRINVTDVTDAVYNDELRYLSDTLGRENVVVLIDDLDDSGPDMRSRILQNQPSIERLSRDLILCDRDKRRNLETIDGLIKALNTLNLATKQEVTSSDSYTIQKTSSSSSSQYGADPGGSLTRGSIKSNPERSDRRHGGGDPSDPPNQAPEGSAPLSGNNSQSHPSRGDQERSKNSRKSNRSSNRREDKAVVSSGNPGGGVRSFLTSVFQTFTQHAAQIFSSTRHTIGIFSRSAEEDYSWLQTRLRSDGFRDWVQEVIPCYISSSGFRQFHQDVSQCSFGILYHTKNRGTINVTDMRGALYDEELRYLSDTLGKQRVVVLIDDLEDSSSVQKTQILDSQPSIRRLARNLILINKSYIRRV